MRMLAISSGIAVGTCTLITPYWFFSSSSAAGTMLKLAAIGVISVPQKPDSIPTAPITAGLPPSAWIRIGTRVAAPPRRQTPAPAPRAAAPRGWRAVGVKQRRAAGRPRHHRERRERVTHDH